MRKLTEMSEYDIRYSEKGDDQKLLEWMKWPAMTDNFPVETEREIELFVRNWGSFFRYKSGLTALYKGEPVGMAVLFLMPYKKVSRHGMLYFLVDPKLHRKGIGSSLIRNIVHLGKTRFHLERIYLDVFEGSNAKPFLEKCGFREVFYQARFVKEPKGTYRGRYLMEERLV